MRSRNSVPFLDASRIGSLLPPAAALAAVQRFFDEHRRDEVAVPDRIHLRVPGQDTVGLYMPAATREFVGVKLVHLMPSRRPAVQAEIFLYRAATGELLFWGDGKPLTGIRTAAVSAAASLRLKPEARTLVVFGSGVQAAAHVRALLQCHPGLRSVRVVARSAESLRRFEDLLGQPDARVAPSDSPERDLGTADLVVTATPSPHPLFAWSQVRPGALVIGVGSATPAMNELPHEAFRQSDVWVDSRRALTESGDCLAALRAGWREGELAGDLFNLLGARKPPPSVRPNVVFKSAGHAAQDLALLIELWNRLQENDSESP